MTETLELPDPTTLAWVEGILGPFRVVSQFGHDHGYSKLWRIEAGSDYVWLKMHAHARKWAGEVHALGHWREVSMPELLGYRDDPRAILITECPGVHAEAIEFSPAAEERLWSQAGEWLRHFHRRTNDWIGEIRPDGTPGAEPTSDASAHVAKTFYRRLKDGRDRGNLNEAEYEFAEGRFLEGLPSLEGATAHSIHRDYHPRNWLAQPDGTLTAVIDFEHARWDVVAADLNRPWDKEFYRNPRLVDAFYEAYGIPDERRSTQIQTLRLYNIVCGVVWALEVNDYEFSEFNRRALHRMMASTR